MIYTASVYARRGWRDLGHQVNFRVRTKIAGYLFQAVEEMAIYLNKDVGEEIFCVSSAPSAKL